MEPAMDGFEPLLIHVCVNLGRGNIRMPEHFLDDPEIRAIAEEMGCEAVSQEMRIHISIQSRMFRVMFHNLPDPDRGQPCPPR